MQSNTQMSNNPRNPLVKAAALEIDKTVSRGKKPRVAVRVSLTFKKAYDMRGYATDESGQRITVRFSLAVRAASFTLTARNENGAPAKFSYVAFETPLGVETTIVETRESRSTRKGELSLTGRVRAAISQATFGGTAAVDTSVDLGRNSSHGNTLSESANITSLNVSPTYADGRIHWSIKPALRNSSADAGSFLSGSVFAGLGAKRRMDACRIRHAVNCPSTGWEVSGSVTADVTDLDITAINFTYDDGTPLPDPRVREIKLNASAPKNTASPCFQSLSDRKIKIMRQVIIKHLAMQNMNSAGSMIEICYASA